MNGNGHWTDMDNGRWVGALGIHTHPLFAVYPVSSASTTIPEYPASSPAWGLGGHGKGKVRARVVQSVAGLLLYRIRRADQEVLCISCPYWRLLLPVKGLPHLCLLWYCTTHLNPSHPSGPPARRKEDGLPGTDTRHSSIHPAGRNSLKELPGWDLKKRERKAALPWLPKWIFRTIYWGRATGTRMALVDMAWHGMVWHGTVMAWRY